VRFLDRLPQLGLPILFSGIAIVAWWNVSGISDLGSLFPQLVAGGLLVCCAAIIAQLVLTRQPSTIFSEPDDGLTSLSGLVRFGTLFALVGLAALIGLVPAALVYVTAVLQVWWKPKLPGNLVLGCLASIALIFIGQLMGLQYPPGILQAFVRYPFWLGG
jgi:hypothetical protein